MDPRFAHVTDWIFDLDNCLYPASAGLFDLIDERMGAYIERLLGVRPGRGAARPEGAFPRPWHDARRADEAPRRRPAPLPRRRPRHLRSTGSPPIRGSTRGSAGSRGANICSPTATRLMRGACSTGSGSRTISTHLHDIHAAELRPKPDRARLSPADRPARDRSGARPRWSRTWRRTSSPAKSLGMTTVWVDNGSERGNHGYDPAVVDHRITDVADWLDEILKGPA